MSAITENHPSEVTPGKDGGGGSSSSSSNDEQREPWDKASSQSKKIIEKEINDPGYQGPNPKPGEFPRGRWVILEREIKDPLKCLNANQLFRVGKIKNVLNFFQHMVGLPAPPMNRHGYMDPNPGQSTLAWVGHVYRSLFEENVLEYEHMQGWDLAATNMKTFRLLLSIEERERRQRKIYYAQVDGRPKPTEDQLVRRRDVKPCYDLIRDQEMFN